jgi:hypothetical protein
MPAEWLTLRSFARAFELAVDLIPIDYVPPRGEIKCPSDKFGKPFVEYQSRREARINKLLSIKFNHDNRNQKGERHG